MTEQRFDGILVDFYGTICAGDREAVDAVCHHVVEDCGLALRPPELAIRWGERFFHLLERSNGDSFRTLHACVVLSLQTTLAEFGRTREAAPFITTLEEYWMNPPVHADAVDFLEQLELPVCCVSNADTRPLMAAIDKHGLRFDAVISSESVRCYKPGPAIFEQALGVLGIEARRALHVGDSLYADVEGASRLGITTAWVRRENRIHDIGYCKPDHTLATLSELNDVLWNRGRTFP